MSSQSIISEFFNISIALIVISSKFPIGVETIYKLLLDKVINEKQIIIIISYILLFFNSNLFSNENNNILKIGLLAPLSGEYKNFGNSLYCISLQMAFEEINDKNVF